MDLEKILLPHMEKTSHILHLQYIQVTLNLCFGDAAQLRPGRAIRSHFRCYRHTHVQLTLSVAGRLVGTLFTLYEQYFFHG